MRHHRGFTMVELIVVMVLVGIVSTIAVSRFFERTSFDASAWADQVKSMLRLGQKIAIAQNRPVFVLLQENRVALCLVEAAACPDASQVRAPGGANSGSDATRAACGSATWMCEAGPQGLALAVPSAAIRFDGLGRAGSGGRSVITIGGDSLTRTIGIEAETGHVD